MTLVYTGIAYTAIIIQSDICSISLQKQFTLFIL